MLGMYAISFQLVSFLKSISYFHTVEIPPVFDGGGTVLFHSFLLDLRVIPQNCIFSKRFCVEGKWAIMIGMLVPAIQADMYAQVSARWPYRQMTGSESGVSSPDGSRLKCWKLEQFFVKSFCGISSLSLPGIWSFDFRTEWLTVKTILSVLGVWYHAFIMMSVHLLIRGFCPLVEISKAEHENRINIS